MSGVRTINKGQTFKFTGTNSLNNKVVDGSYLIRIRVLDHKNNKIIDENSFNVTVKKPLSVAKKPIVKKK